MKNSKKSREPAHQAMLRNELAKDSLLVRRSSMKVLAIFEQLQDEILES